MKIMGTYKILYSNGVEQTKTLIRQTDYQNIIRPIQDRIYDLSYIKKDRSVSVLKRYITENFGENWFTHQSPVGLAIHTGIIRLPKSQGGDHNCRIVRQ